LTFRDPELAFRRRGAPFTFDAEAVVELVKTLKNMPVTTGEEPEVLIYAPSFDHAVKDPVQGAISISSRNRIIIIEGNYTLLNQSPWNEIAELSKERSELSNAFAGRLRANAVQMVYRRTCRGSERTPYSTPSRCRYRDFGTGRFQKSGGERYSEWRADTKTAYQARCYH